MPSTRAWLALTAALALVAPLGALADPQRQGPPGTQDNSSPGPKRSSFTNFDVLKQLMKDHHAQTGKTVRARRSDGVVNRLGNFLDANNAVRRRRLLGGDLTDTDTSAQAASNPPPPPSPPPPSPPPRETPILDQLAQLLDRNASTPIFPQAGPGLDALLTPPNWTQLLAPLTAQGGPLQPFAGLPPAQLADGPIAALLANITNALVQPFAGPNPTGLFPNAPNWTEILGAERPSLLPGDGTLLQPFGGLPPLTLPNGTIREQLAALLGNATDGPIFPQSGPLVNLTGGLLNPPNWTELLQPFAGPLAGSVGIQAPNWTQILAPFRGAGLQLPEDGVLDGAIRSQLTTLLTNALSSGGGGGGGGILDGSIFPQSGAGIFPMSAGNWLQLLTSAATGNGQQLFSTLAGNAIRNQLLASFGNAIGGGGGGGGGLFDGGIFAQSGPESIFPLADAGSLFDGSLLSSLGGGDSTLGNILPLLIAGISGAANADGTVLAQSDDSTSLPWLSPDWTLDLPAWPEPRDATAGSDLFDGALRERLVSLFTPTDTDAAPGALFDGSLFAQSGGDDAGTLGAAAAPAWLNPDWSLLGGAGAAATTPGTQSNANEFLAQLLALYEGDAADGSIAAQSGEDGTDASSGGRWFDATRPAGGDGWFISDWTLLGRLAALADGPNAEESAGAASGGAFREGLASMWGDTWFSQIVGSVMQRRQDAQQPPSPPPAASSGTGAAPSGMTGTTYPPSYPNGPPIPPRDDDDVAASGGPSMDSLMANLRHANGTINPETVSDITAVLGTLAGVNVTGADFDNALALAVAAGLTGIHKDDDDDNDHDHDHAHSEGHFNLADTQQATQYREMFGAALRSAGDFIEEQFAASADADGSVGDGDSDGVESLVAAAIKVAEDNADHFIDIGHGQGAEGADTAVDADTAVELLDRVQGVLAAARGDFHAMLEQSQQAQGNKAPGAPDGYLTAAQLLTLMGGMSGLPGMDDSIGDPTVPGVKWPFNATDNTEALGNIADKVNDDPLGYLDGLIDDLINPRDDGLVGAQSGPQQNDAPTIDIGAQGDESGDGRSSAAKFFEKTEAQVAIPVAAIVLAGGIFAAYTSGLSGRLFGAAAPAAPSGDRSGANDGNGNNRMFRSEGDVATGASTAVNAGGDGQIVRRTSTSTKIEMSTGDGGVGNGQGGRAVGGLESMRRGFRDLTSRAGRSASEARAIRDEKARA